MIRHRTHDHRSSTNLDVISDADIAQNFRTGSDYDAVADGRMPLAGILPRSAERHALVQQHVVSDLGCLADHHAHSVIDEETAPDSRARMDLDARHRSRELRNDARESKPSREIQTMRDPVQHCRVESRIAQQYFEH